MIFSGHLKILFYICEGSDSKFSISIHTTKSTLIMGTADRRLDQQTISFTGWTIDSSFVTQLKHSYLYFQFPYILLILLFYTASAIPVSHLIKYFRIHHIITFWNFHYEFRSGIAICFWCL